MRPVPDVVVIGAGQSGLAATKALQAHGISPLVLEARGRAAGSWPSYYDSLKAFSPAGFSSMPGMPFPGDPDRYPTRDEVADYLDSYAAALGVEIRTNTPVADVRSDGREFMVVTADGRHLRATGIVAASGSFSSPHRPTFPGQDGFTGELTHVADYRNPAPYAGKRVIVVGAGDSAAQVASELAPFARVTLATRHPLRFIPQRIGGKDVHYWLRETGFDSLPAEWLNKITGGSVITDSVAFSGRSRTVCSTSARCSPALMTTRSSGTTTSESGSMRSSWPPATVPASATSATWAPWTLQAHRCMQAGFRPPTWGWSTSAWNTSARSPRTPSAGSSPMPRP